MQLITEGPLPLVIVTVIPPSDRAVTASSRICSVSSGISQIWCLPSHPSPLHAFTPWVFIYPSSCPMVALLGGVPTTLRGHPQNLPDRFGCLLTPGNDQQRAPWRPSQQQAILPRQNLLCTAPFRRPPFYRQLWPSSGSEVTCGRSFARGFHGHNTGNCEGEATETCAGRRESGAYDSLLFGICPTCFSSSSISFRCIGMQGRSVRCACMYLRVWV